MRARWSRPGADPNAFENDRYDIVTIAAVADDVPTLEVALAAGGSARATSPAATIGTALIAAAHLGHDGVVRTLIKAGAPLDHVNNLGWTAVIESIVLGDGGALQPGSTLKALVDAGANVGLADRSGTTPLALARARGVARWSSCWRRRARADAARAAPSFAARLARAFDLAILPLGLRHRFRLQRFRRGVEPYEACGEQRGPRRDQPTHATYGGLDGSSRL